MARWNRHDLNRSNPRSFWYHISSSVVILKNLKISTDFCEKMWDKSVKIHSFYVFLLKISRGNIVPSTWKSFSACFSSKKFDFEVDKKLIFGNSNCTKFSFFSFLQNFEKIVKNGKYHENPLIESVRMVVLSSTYLK